MGLPAWQRNRSPQGDEKGRNVSGCLEERKEGGPEAPVRWGGGCRAQGIEGRDGGVIAGGGRGRRGVVARSARDAHGYP